MSPTGPGRPARTTDRRGETGRRGESLVAARLESDGFEIVARNVRVGRLELDIVARRGTLLVVCEVRTRRSARFMHPAASIDRAKALRVRRAAARWLAQSGLPRGDLRLDAAAVVLEGPGGEPEITYYEGAL